MLYEGRTSNGMVIKQRAKSKNIYLWEIADAIGIADSTLSKWLRHPTDPQLMMIEDAFSRVESLKG